MTLIFAGVMVPGERIKCLLQVICDRKILKFFILRGYLKVQSARGNLSGLPYRNIYFLMNCGLYVHLTFPLKSFPLLW